MKLNFEITNNIKEYLLLDGTLTGLFFDLVELLSGLLDFLGVSKEVWAVNEIFNTYNKLFKSMLIFYEFLYPDRNAKNEDNFNKLQPQNDELEEELTLSKISSVNPVENKNSDEKVKRDLESLIRSYRFKNLLS